MFSLLELFLFVNYVFSRDLNVSNRDFNSAEIPSASKDTTMKIIFFRIFASKETIDELNIKGMDLNRIVQDTKHKLQETINSVLARLGHKMRIAFDYEVGLEVPMGINLNQCTPDVSEIANMLSIAYKADQNVPSILLLHCKSENYNQLFLQRNIRVPYFYFNLFPSCTTNTLIFYDPERVKLMVLLATAMLTAAGVKTPAPVLFQEIQGDDAGVTHAIRLTDDTVRLIIDNSCFASHK
ncbi:hypothetical protein SLOPH_2344 [Spraguea lophii 42_110]|uniref:Uncharacterized protein n=1 Tax=Spraguea lophii (strain 42_110) TaxID=1358809 RepID=S7W7E5_SPRLO|nr:hypothetical protein SLOPH_2344 [Spraguea lophii 42_110]